MTSEIQKLQAALREFSRVRDWEQFHSPKNLASALVVEAAELLEPFQWLTEEQSRQLSIEKKVHVCDEIADVLLYLLQLADVLQIDPLEAAWRKLTANADKYPVPLAKGSSAKYTDF
jgi:NTP pyrophosphatase (non-canonical NTP hydrolase)